jgi:hypothetical protein
MYQIFDAGMLDHARARSERAKITQEANTIERFHMNRGICLLFVICIYVSALAQKKGPSITAYSVDMNIETFTSIPCHDFMKQFQGRMDTTICNSMDSLEIIAAFLKKVRYSKDPWNIDTRAKFVFVSKAGNFTNIYMDRFRIYVNGRMIEDYPQFYKYLYSLIAKKQTKIKIK